MDTAEKIKQVIADSLAELDRRPVRKVFGAKVSEDYGQTWRIRALCDVCIKAIEPPRMVKKEIEAGTYTCDWCGCRNEMYAKKITN